MSLWIQFTIFSSFGSCFGLSWVIFKWLLWQQREVSVAFLAEIVTKFDECDTSLQCIILNESTGSQLYKICKGSAICSTNNANSGDDDAISRTDSKKDDLTTPTHSPAECPSVGTKQSCNGLAIGMLILGMVLGSVTMAVVCVFVPNLHRMATKILNKSAAKKRQSQWSRMSTRSHTEPSTTQAMSAPTPNPVDLSIEQPTYQEVDGDNEPREYQTLDRSNERDGHVYSGLDQQQHIYNELGEATRRIHEDNPGNNVDTRANATLSNDNNDITDNTTNHTTEGANYFVLEPSHGATTIERRTGAVDQDPVNSLSDDQPHYFKLEDTQAKYVVLEPTHDASAV